MNDKGDNELSGQIPSEIGNITSLQIIDVGKILLRHF